MIISSRMVHSMRFEKPIYLWEPPYFTLSSICWKFSSRSAPKSTPPHWGFKHHRFSPSRLCFVQFSVRPYQLTRYVLFTIWLPSSLYGQVLHDVKRVTLWRGLFRLRIDPNQKYEWESRMPDNNQPRLVKRLSLRHTLWVLDILSDKTMKQTSTRVLCTHKADI